MTGDIFAKGGSREWPQGSRRPPGTPLVGAAPGGLLGSFPLKLRYSSDKYPPSIFSTFGDVLFQQLNVHFSLLNPASAVSAPESCKLCKTSQNNIRTTS